MIDLHIHLLPGIDDGAADLEESVAMCRQAAAAGCEALVATPHQRHEQWWNTDRVELDTLLRQVQERVGSEPELHLGGEIRVDSGLLEALDELPKSGVLPLAESSYLLLEFDRQGLGPDPETVVHEVSIAGWRPIVAHPEFVPQLVADPTRVGRLTELGGLVQVTAASVTGQFGPKTARFVRRLLTDDLVHFVASDAHGVRWRQPGLREAHQAIASRWGEERARLLTKENPLSVLHNRPLKGGSTPA